MKTWIIVAAVALAPMSVRALSLQAGSPLIPAAEGARAELIKEIEVSRANLLPQTEPLPQVTVRYQPRLNDLKASAIAAGTSAELAKIRTDFNSWKTVVLHDLHHDTRRLVSGAGSFEAFAAQKNLELDFAFAFREQIASQHLDAESKKVRAMSMKVVEPGIAWSGVFDNAAPSRAAVADNAVRAEAPRPAGDPARYDKIRALLLSKGVSRQIVDTAIAEGIRQKVDPMIVLSVINQESNFKKNAYNRGSGCIGLMQLDPATAADMGVRGNLYDPNANIKAGTKYLNWIANSFFKMGQDLSDMSKVPAEKLEIILASYNWGIGNVQKAMRKHGAAALDRVAPKETRNYIAEIPSRIYNWFASF